MAKYPLNQCSSCIHRNVCRIVDDLNYISDSDLLPIDFSPSKCNEYNEDFNLSVRDWLFKAIEDVKEEGTKVMEVIKNIEQLLDYYDPVIEIVVSKDVYELIEGHDFGVDVVVERDMDDGLIYFILGEDNNE